MRVTDTAAPLSSDQNRSGPPVYENVTAATVKLNTQYMLCALVVFA